MRHRCKVHHLGKPADQRKALLRSLSTSLFVHGRIQTTLKRAKALQSQADKIVELAKRGDVHAMRQVRNLIYNQVTLEGTMPDGDERTVRRTALRIIFREVGPRFTERKGGYTRIYHLPPRRGDNAPMALIELVD
jgi:large subunit ribosomal protein L17